MVTFAFFLVLILSLTVIAFIDMVLYKSGLLESFQSLLSIEGPGRWIILSSTFLGLVLSVINDIRLAKNKRVP
jgi:hypothetical protein